MTLQKQSVGIPLGGGVEEGTGSKLLDPPALLDLVDARWDKRGEYAKRFGSESVPTSGLVNANANALLDHDGALVQYSASGTSVWGEGPGEWRNDPASPRAARITTHPLAVDSGSYHDADTAYEPTSGLVCVVCRDDTYDRVLAYFLDAEDGHAVSPPVELPAELVSQPRVVAFDGRFLVLALGVWSGGATASSAVWAASYDASTNAFTFGAAVEIGSVSSGALSDYDAHVASATQEHAHVVWCNGARWHAAKVASDGTVIATRDNSIVATGDADSVTIVHNPNVGIVYVLHDDNLVGGVLFVALFSDTYDSLPTRRTAMTYTTRSRDRRVTAAIGSSHSVRVFVSHDTCNGGDVGGVEWVSLNSAGSPNSAQGFAPGLILASKAVRDGYSRVIVGVSREIRFEPSDPAGVGGAAEPLPSGFLVTPTTAHGTPALAVLGRYGHDAIACGSWQRQSAKYLGAIASVGSEYWGAYTALAQRNDGAPSTVGVLSLPDRDIAYGWRWSIRTMRARLEPAPVRTSSAEGLSLLGGGVLAAYDGQRTAELAIPVVPHAPIPAGRNYSSACVGAEGTAYSFVSASSIPGAGTGSGVGDVLLATCSFKIAFRWIDALGNVRRSSVSEAMERTYLVPNGPPPSLGYSDSVASAFDRVSTYFVNVGGLWEPDTDQRTRILVIPLPGPSALGTDPDTKIQVEIYRTEFTYERWDAIAGSSNDVLLGTLEGDSDFRLCGVVDVGTVTGYPNMGWVEDPCRLTVDGTQGGPQPSAPTAYDEGGELGSEPLPPILDVASTQRRLFAIDAEDRLSVWFSKPFVAGYAPEFNAALRIRCAAEGGDLVALATLDDKLVLFKERRIYVTPVFSGPDANGNGTAFQPPREVAADTGCVNANSVATGPWGVVFQSERGIYALGRDLGLTWIGEAVKDSLGDATILAATVVPEATEVRFLLSTGRALVWDYRVGSWATWDNVPGAHATTWRGKWARLLSGGSVEHDSEGYDAPDTSDRPMLSITTAWVKLAQGLQGYQRIWTASILGDHYSGDLAVDVGYDYEDEWTDSHSFREAEIQSWERMQIKIKPTRQKCMAIRFRVREIAMSGTAATVGRGFVLQSLQLEVGIKRGSYKMVLPVQRRGGPDLLELTGVSSIELTGTDSLETPR